MQRPRTLCCPIMALAIATAATLLAGCDDDEKFVELARQSAERRAEQNRLVAQQSQTVAETTRELVREDATARRELITAQKDLETSLQTERKSLDDQRVSLAEERREVAAERNREPIIAAAITWAGLLLAVALPLAFCLYLVRSLGTVKPSAALEELLIAELVAEEPTRLSPPPIGVRTPALESPERIKPDE